MTARYTPKELRELADSRGKNPYWADQVRQALHYAANVLDAADTAVNAERKRADDAVKAAQGDKP